MKTTILALSLMISSQSFSFAAVDTEREESAQTEEHEKEVKPSSDNRGIYALYAAIAGGAVAAASWMSSATSDTLPADETQRHEQIRRDAVLGGWVDKAALATVGVGAAYALYKAPQIVTTTMTLGSIFVIYKIVSGFQSALGRHL